MDSPRVRLIQRLFELMDTHGVSSASEELLAHSAENVIVEPRAGHGRVIRGHDELRRFWADFAREGNELRAGAYSVKEEGDRVVVTGWVRTISAGALADTQSRWVYRFNDDDQIVSARAELD